MGKLDSMLQVGRTFGLRDGMLRLQYELRRGSGLMARKMRSVHGWQAWTLGRIAPGVSPEEFLSARRGGAVQFFFQDVRSLRAEIREIAEPEGEASVLAQAEEILNGKLPYFGQLRFSGGFPPRWFQNPVTGQSVSPQKPWTQMRFASPDHGDLKFILEPSRFLFVYPLVRAYAISGDERFPQAFWSALEDWTLHSPPMAGPLWICGQESSLRILALSFALHAFLHSPSTTNQRAALLVSMIAAHAWRTAQTVGYARSQRSNHLISEGVGLWTAGTLYPELAEAKVWQHRGAQLVHEAVLDQITPEGISQQHSFNYERMILQLLLWMLRLSEIHGFPIHEHIRQRTRSAYEFIHQWVDPISGHVPNYGSDDGSLLLPLSCGSYRDYRPLLQLGAPVLNRPALKPGPWDEAALWFGLEPNPGRKTDSGSEVPTETGYFRLGDDDSWAMIRAGRYRRRPFQADQLHLDLWWKGTNLARDPGTYLYNGEVPWNNGFAGTAVHNTVMVDQRDQMRRAGRFLWVDWSQASGRVYSSRGGAVVDTFEGQHDGYKDQRITHHRMVRWLAGSGWVIVDDLEGSGDHHARLHWLVPNLPVQIADSFFQVRFKLDHGCVRWNTFSSAPGHSAVIRCGKVIETSGASMPEAVHPDTQLLGWESPTYGALEPAISMIYETQSQLPVRFVTIVLTGEHCRLELSADEVILLENQPVKNSQGCEIYRVSLSPSSTFAANRQRSSEKNGETA